MPIYAYRCASCGHAKDVLQKLSDPLLTTCPACGQEAFSKQLTAAGFQLKGSGWYVTDFRGGSSAPAADKAAPEASQAAPADPAGAGKSPEKAAAAPMAEASATKTESKTPVSAPVAAGSDPA